MTPASEKKHKIIQLNQWILCFHNGTSKLAMVLHVKYPCLVTCLLTTPRTKLLRLIYVVK